MADPRINPLSRLFSPNVESDQLVAASEFADKIVNLEPTPEGGLRTISGPALMPDATDTTTVGIGHAMVRGKSILVRQTTTELQVFNGAPAAPWTTLKFLGGDAVNLATVGDTPDRPFKSIPTPRGLIILPAGVAGRPLFYDGEVLTRLGFRARPTAPSTSVTQGESVADLETDSATLGRTITDAKNRVGEVESLSDSGNFRGRRRRYETQYVAQWVDRYGNVSPQSARSGKVSVDAANIHTDHALEGGLFRVRLGGFETDARNVVGTIVGRTRNLHTSGDSTVYELPQHRNPSTTFVATIPSIGTTVYMDNTPDGALLAPMVDVAPVPRATTGTLALGRLWLAAGDAVWASLPGRHGTFAPQDVVYPDATGEDITAVHGVPGGAVACTLSSTFFLQPSEDGDGIRQVSVSTRHGCAAPNSMQTLPNGLTIWLSRSGWVGYNAGEVAPLSGSHQRLVRELNIGRMRMASSAVINGRYHCWVARGAEKVPATCVIFDQAGRLVGRRDDCEARSVVTLTDHTEYTLVAGQDASSNRDGVMVLNHEGAELGARTRGFELETGWMLANGVDRRSTRRIIVWARETDGTASLTVEVMRDWRETVIDTLVVPLYPVEDPPLTWDDSLLGTGVWSRRRPYYGVVDIDVPSHESIKLRFSQSLVNVELLGFVLQAGAGTRSGSFS